VCAIQTPKRLEDFQRRTDHCIFKTRPKHSQSYKLSPKQEEKGNDVRLEGEVGVEKARQEERGTCEKRTIFLKRQKNGASEK